jgi:chemotaxis protein methyltransferase CheR
MTLIGEIQPIAPTGSLLEGVTDEEFSLFSKLIYEKTGIQISSRKQTLLSNRLRRRLRSTGIGGFGDYYQRLKRLPAADPEWDAFLQEITTHETYLFRDEAQWVWFRNVYLPERGAAKNRGPGLASLRIWSAACSTGDEAYTAACCVAACLPGFREGRVSIVGTDIGLGALAEARKALFNDRAMRLVPPEYRRAYFTEIEQGRTWQAKPILSGMVTFRQHNLMTPLGDRPFDLVFLKNVLIYFDAVSKGRAVDRILPMIRPGGMLVVGASEGVSDLLRGFVRIQPWLYRRPEQQRTVRE